jgi:hypothetical protein
VEEGVVAGDVCVRGCGMQQVGTPSRSEYFTGTFILVIHLFNPLIIR